MKPQERSTLRLTVRSEDETERFASHLSTVLTPGTVAGFAGALGAGKSHCIRALLRARGVEGSIPSPTFTLMNAYEGRQSETFLHIDAFRLSSDEDLDDLGWDDFTDPIILIEWIENVTGVESDYMVQIADGPFGEDSRTISICGPKQGIAILRGSISGLKAVTN